MSAHLLAVAYLTVVSAVVVIVEAHFGVRLETVWGLQFRTPVVYPLAFWSATFLYAYFSGRQTGLALREWVSRAILLGAWVHLNLLAITMSHETVLLAQLTSGSFTAYIGGFVGAVAILSCVLSAVCCAAFWRGWRDEFWLPVAYLPLAHVLLQRAHGFSLALIGTGLVVSAVIVADRGSHRRLVEAAKRWWPRLWNDATIVLGIYLVAFLFRFVAAERLSGMGIQTIMTNTDDPDQYHRAALAILNGEWAKRYTSIGYDVFLAGLYWLTNARLDRVLVLQSVLTSTVAVAVYLMGRRLFSRTAGITAALLAAFSQLLIFNSVNLTREVAGTLFVAWGVLLLVVLPGEPRKGREWWILPAGVVFGFLTAYDPTFLGVSAGLAMAFLFCRRFPVWHRTRRIALFLGLACLVAFGTIRFATGDRTILARQDVFMAADVSSHFNPYSYLLLRRRINAFAYPTELAPNLLVDPVGNAKLIAQKLWVDGRRFLFEGNSGRFDPITLIYGSFFAANVDFYGYFFGFLGAVVGLRGIRTKPVRLDRAALYAVLLIYATTYIVMFFGMTRFRAPVQPLLLVLVGAGIATVFRFAAHGAFPGLGLTQSTRAPADAGS
jgi:hypothetical protein